MEKFVEQSLLYDFYGELLTEHQQKIYEDAVFDDFSVSEIARNEGISRQGVHDLIKRCNKILSGYEERLHLVERFLRIREQVREIKTLVKEDNGLNGAERSEKIDRIVSDILEEL
jgi:predicted DNA-binding protein YlxM (UPF0122 family)